MACRHVETSQEEEEEEEGEENTRFCAISASSGFFRYKQTKDKPTYGGNKSSELIRMRSAAVGQDSADSSSKKTRLTSLGTFKRQFDVRAEKGAPIPIPRPVTLNMEPWTPNINLIPKLRREIQP